MSSPQSFKVENLPCGRSGRPRQSRFRQQGVAALATALLTLGVAGLSLGNFWLKHSIETRDTVQAQLKVMGWANLAVRNYFMVHGRLPCPANTPRGAQSCGGSAKGWLPVATLISVTGDAPPEQANLDVRYMVNRTAGTREVIDNLNVFRPALITGGVDTAYPSGIVSSLDACTSLFRMNAGHGERSRWVIPPDLPIRADASVPVTQVVYGIAVAAFRAPKDASGINADFSQAEMESPLRENDARYTDLVSVTTPEAYYQELACDSAMASMDTMHIMSEWTGDAAGLREGNIVVGAQLRDIILLGVGADTAFLLAQMADLMNGIYNIFDNFSKLLAAIASFQFYKIPTYIKGLILAPPGIVVSTIDIAFTSISLAMDAALAAAYGQLSSEAKSLPVWQGAREMTLSAHRTGITPELPPANVLLGVTR